MKFENDLKRLEDILSLLEIGNLPLEESIKLYSEGVTLAADCKKQLDEAKLTINKGL